MRKVTAKIAEAWNGANSLTIGDTHTDGTSVWLHGKKIVSWPKTTTIFTLAGWPTPTTIERINGMLDRIYKGGNNGPHRPFIYQRGNQQYFCRKLGEAGLPIDSNSWYSSTLLMSTKDPAKSVVDEEGNSIEYSPPDPYAGIKLVINGREY